MTPPRLDDAHRQALAALHTLSTTGELAARLGAPVATVAGMLETLSVAGYVSRHEHRWAITLYGVQSLEGADDDAGPLGHMVPRAAPDSIIAGPVLRRDCRNYARCLDVARNYGDAACPRECRWWACPRCGATETPHACAVRVAHNFTSSGRSNQDSAPAMPPARLVRTGRKERGK